MNSPIKVTELKSVPSVDINNSLKFDSSVELNEPSQLEKRNILILRLGVIFGVGVIVVVTFLFFRFLVLFVLH